MHVLLPIVVRFRDAHPAAQIEMRRVHSRQIPSEVLNRSLDFGFVTFEPAERGLLSVALGIDELVMLAHPKHPLARRRQITMEEFGRQTVIAHNDPLAQTGTGAAPVRGKACAYQHPTVAGESRRDQAGGRNGAGGRPAAAPLRAVGDCPQAARRGTGAPVCGCRATCASSIVERASRRPRPARFWTRPGRTRPRGSPAGNQGNHKGCPYGVPRAVRSRGCRALSRRRP